MNALIGRFQTQYKTLLQKPEKMRLVDVLPHLLGLLRRLALGAAKEPVSRVLLLVVQRDSRVGIVEIGITMSSIIL